MHPLKNNQNRVTLSGLVLPFKGIPLKLTPNLIFQWFPVLFSVFVATLKGCGWCGA